MNQETMEKIDLTGIFRGLLRNARHHLVEGAILLVVLVSLLCLNTWRSYSPVYQASATFTVKTANPLYAEQAYYNSAAAEQMAKTFPYILTSGALTQQVQQELGIAYMPSVSVAAMGNTNILTLSVTDSAPQRAYDVLQCVMEKYPAVAEFVVGPTVLELLSESGVPSQPMNTLSYRGAMVKGIAAALVIWCAWLLLYTLMHRTVGSEEDLAKVVNLECIGRLPTVRGFSEDGDGVRCPVLTEGADKFGFNESVRLLRVRVEKALAQNKGKVLMVTSSIANEGKTTVSVNLATALAGKGKKTLLVDCDLRNPSVATTLHREGKTGFVGYLRGDETVESILTRGETPNLFTVLGGQAVANPEALLGGKTAKNFVQAARKSFDYIILDTPPCAMLADAAELITVADGVLLTIRQDFASRAQVSESAQILNDSGKPIIGCVLTMTTPRLSKSGYGYHNGYGGYYGGYYGRDNGAERDET